MNTTYAEAFFDTQTSTYSYVVHATGSAQCAIIDPVLDYEPQAAKTSTESAQKLLDYISKNELELQWIIETHAHADHMSAAAWIQQQLGGKIAIGAPISVVQSTFKNIYNLDDSVKTNGEPFDVLFKSGDQFKIGEMLVDVLHVPGHTPADMAYHVHHLGIFVGDTLFLPDVGSARCDFPGGNAEQLYDSAQKILSFPDDTVLFMCHDYPPAGREEQYSCTVAEQKAHNIHLRDGISKAEFVRMRTERDATLALPRLILPSLQVNIQAGKLPAAESDGHRYLKLPLNRFWSFQINTCLLIKSTLYFYFFGAQASKKATLSK